ncbi:MAG: GNAT family N-acetyltransferase [Clostridiales bacterium]|jgi:ribosomal protein S18 acetylase RimI-like enzyme|nr:GNAT family N-acetyltransferase [Clostridiales bacterium]
MGNLFIRKMTAADYDRVYALWSATPGMGLNNIDDSRAGIEKFLRRNPDTCFVAERGAGLVGVILSGHDGRRGSLNHLAVRVSERKQGVGRLLVQHAMDALAQEGITKVNLVVFTKNETGNAFWERLGFTARDDLVYRNKNIVELKDLRPE